MLVTKLKGSSVWSRLCKVNLTSLALYLLLVQPGLLQAAQLHRIVVEETNNFRLSHDYQSLVLPDSINTAEFQALRRYVDIKLKHGTRYELENIFTLTSWVHNRWQHDAYGTALPGSSAIQILQAAEQGEHFSCVEYSKVLADVLQAYGYVSRIIDLQSSDIAYAGMGNAHVAVEVYSAQLGKWIFLDPQWARYLQYQGKPINIYDYHVLKQQGREQAVSIKSTQAKSTRRNNEYRAFIEQYLGFLSVDQLIDQQQVNIILAMQGTSWPLTFQGLPRNAQVFTRDPRDVYFEIERVNLVMNYRKSSQALSHQSLEISSESDYTKKMAKFAAVPDYEVIPHHNMPWFAYFEYKVDRGSWRRLQGTSLNWRLHSKKNRLQVRAVNTAGRIGPVTFIQIRY